MAAGEGLKRIAHYRDVLTRRLRVPSRTVVYGFDTFGGMPAARDGDQGLHWEEGQFAAPIAAVRTRMERFSDVELVPGLFSDTLPVMVERFKDEPLIFVSLDCDWYSSTVDVLRELLPIAPHGSLWYFDDVAANYGTRLTGQLRAIREVNASGDHELVEVPLHIETGQARHWRLLYRLARR